MEKNLMLLREAGNVSRLHTVPLIQKYTVAGHSWGMAMMCLALHPLPRPDLIKACLLHDVAERLIGDVPAPTKWRFEQLTKELDKAEQEAMTELGINFNLLPDEEIWLRALDLLDLLLFCVEEERMGNRNATGVKNVCWSKLYRNKETPQEVICWLDLNLATLMERTTGGWIS